MTSPPDVSIRGLYAEVEAMRADVRLVLTKMTASDVRTVYTDAIHIDHESRLPSLDSRLVQMQTDLTRIRSIAATIAGIAGILSGLLAGFASHIH
jgi:hypothetical protein